MRKHLLTGSFVAAALLAILISAGCRDNSGRTEAGLAGAWKGKVTGISGWLAQMKGLEFMYAFNADGTMTESSNYDAFPPGPPAYGVWRKIGARQYEAKYAVFLTKPVSIFTEIAKGGGWKPNGHGMLSQKVSLSADGNSFESTIRFDLFDPEGKPVKGGGEASGHGERIRF